MILGIRYGVATKKETCDEIARKSLSDVRLPFGMFYGFVHGAMSRGDLSMFRLWQECENNVSS